MNLLKRIFRKTSRRTDDRSRRRYIPPEPQEAPDALKALTGDFDDEAAISAIRDAALATRPSHDITDYLSIWVMINGCTSDRIDDSLELLTLWLQDVMAAEFEYSRVEGIRVPGETRFQIFSRYAAPSSETTDIGLPPRIEFYETHSHSICGWLKTFGLITEKCQLEIGDLVSGYQRCSSAEDLAALVHTVSQINLRHDLAITERSFNHLFMIKHDFADWLKRRGIPIPAGLINAGANPIKSWPHRFRFTLGRRTTPIARKIKTADSPLYKDIIDLLPPDTFENYRNSRQSLHPHVEILAPVLVKVKEMHGRYPAHRPLAKALIANFGIKKDAQTVAKLVKEAVSRAYQLQQPAR
ncbi:hypothetical protein [Gimibacter soli]|uniref:Uncharacterized protein n=1 Tax=Gimibacter soli TaxID=3024400 RepID=A0AAE9XXM5_9PROT|nr:hypothetical protein [Gimibacter soli]WCL55584.1 hypothetical protein PH603_07390 [Gimibacter soli]